MVAVLRGSETAWAPGTLARGELPGQAAAVLPAACDRADDRARPGAVHADETGKVDAGISAGTRTAFGVYEEAAAWAGPAFREVASDRRLRAALAAGIGVEARLEELVGGPYRIVLIELYSPEEERLVARAGPPDRRSRWPSSRARPRRPTPSRRAAS